MVLPARISALIFGIVLELIDGVDVDRLLA
jgi:hypothetical protein